ncbi:Hypothetical predicted protein [Olea europaea subsp. europaea]|uniref:Uncharacterized protein n=1 Tax=Olea europaea subsp. europaea TaxID=158383 RepID=A0A8S0T1T5_OLEEU|nr:Hypothetical predicted protein [Olea europaea subsp. europaea]
MDLLQYKKRRIDFFDDRILETDSDDDILFDDGYFQAEYSERSDARVDWGMSENSSSVHPVCFAKCLKRHATIVEVFMQHRFSVWEEMLMNLGEEITIKKEYHHAYLLTTGSKPYA